MCIFAGLHDEKEQVADLEAELSKVQAEQNALPALLQEVQAALDAEARSADADASDFAARETEQQKTVSGVNEALQMYQQRLGLSFTHNTSEGSVDMVFTMIDSEQPDKEFKLSVAISEVDDRYVARSCVPPLANIQTLIDELNVDGSFAKFVRAARVAFQATVAAPK
jgi:Skp family chaperone for outer membrane proteins